MIAARRNNVCKYRSLISNPFRSVAETEDYTPWSRRRRRRAAIKAALAAWARECRVVHVI